MQGQEEIVRVHIRQMSRRKINQYASNKDTYAIPHIKDSPHLKAGTKYFIKI